MIKQINVDPRLRLDAKGLDGALGSPAIINIEKFDHDSLMKLNESFGVAHTIGQEVIPVVINSYGGACYYLMGMISLFKQSKIPIATIVEGMAMSAGAVLFSMGTEGMRYIAPQGTLMIHDASSMTWGKVEEIKSDAKQLDKLNKTLYEMMAKNCGKSKNYFLDLIHKHGHADWFLDADEALEHNLANKIEVPQFIIDISVKYSMV